MRALLSLLIALAAPPAPTTPTAPASEAAFDAGPIEQRTVARWSLARIWPIPEVPLPPGAAPAELPRPELSAQLRQRLLQTRQRSSDRIDRLIQRALRRLPRGLERVPGRDEDVQMKLTADPQTGGVSALLHLRYTLTLLGPAPRMELACPPAPARRAATAPPAPPATPSSSLPATARSTSWATPSPRAMPSTPRGG